MNGVAIDFEQEYERERVATWLHGSSMSAWVHGLASWQVIAHLTYRWECSLDSGRRCYERWMERKQPEVSYFYAEEPNPWREGYHVHALWAGCGDLFRREAWADWFKRYGRARIEPVRDSKDVASYLSKYVTKGPCWWNAKLQWHELARIRGEQFELERQQDRRLPVPQKEFGFAPSVFNLAAGQPSAVEVLPATVHDDPHQASLWVEQPGGIWVQNPPPESAGR